MKDFAKTGTTTYLAALLIYAHTEEHIALSNHITHTLEDFKTSW